MTFWQFYCKHNSDIVQKVFGRLAKTASYPEDYFRFSRNVNFLTWNWLNLEKKTHWG